jgi:hypothetical protein
VVDHDNACRASKLGIDGFRRKKTPTSPDDSISIPQFLFLNESLASVDRRGYN